MKQKTSAIAATTQHQLWSVMKTLSYLYAVFQLGLFLRALRSARTGLRPARFTRALPGFKKQKNVIAVFLFSNMFSSIAHKTKFCVVCALNLLCPNFSHSRARLCPISFAPRPFPNLAGTLVCKVICGSNNPSKRKVRQ